MYRAAAGILVIKIAVFAHWEGGACEGVDRPAVKRVGLLGAGRRLRLQPDAAGGRQDQQGEKVFFHWRRLGRFLFEGI